VEFALEIQKEIFGKYIEQAAIEQLASEYKQKGYEIVTEYKIGNIQADLLVKKDNDIIVFEIKVGEWNEKKRQLVRKIRNKVVHQLGAKFKMVFVKLPEEPDIIVDDYENLLDELIQEQFIDEFSRLATHFWIDEITDISFNELFIRKVEIEASGSAIVTVGLQYGSDSDYKRDDGIRFTESFSFQFHIVTDKNLKVKEVINLELDNLEDL
jgi:hypothetical protein